MNCIQCQNPNPATVQYCQRCGSKLNLTADEIRDSLIERESLAREDKTSQNAKQALVFGIVAFIGSLTLYFAAGSAPEGALHVPSAAQSGTYAEFQYRYDPDVTKELVPYEEKR